MMTAVRMESNDIREKKEWNERMEKEINDSSSNSDNNTNHNETDQMHFTMSVFIIVVCIKF